MEGRSDSNQVLLKGPGGEDVLIHRGSEVSADGQIVVHPISTLLSVPSSCRLGLSGGECAVQGVVNRYAP